VRAALTAISVPRACGTPGEGDVQDWITGAFRAIGLEVTDEPFDFDPFPARRGAGLFLAGVAVCFSVTALRPALGWAAALALASSIAVLGVVGSGAPRFDRRPRLRGRNLVASRPGEDAPDWIVMAHVDSKSQRCSFAARTALTSVTAGLALAWLASALSGAAPAVARLFAAATALGTFALSALGSGNTSSGALDNASGLALLIELARRNAASRQAPAVRWLVTTAEEDGLVGAQRYFERHGVRLAARGTRVLNIDTIGGRGAFLVTGHRAGRVAAGAGALLEEVKRAAARLGLEVHTRVVPFPAAVDSAMATRHGLAALTIASGGVRDTFRHLHRPSDTPERVCIDQILRGVDLLEAVLERPPGPAGGGVEWRRTD
jgi:hypothetical protein